VSKEAEGSGEASRLRGLGELHSVGTSDNAVVTDLSVFSKYTVFQKVLYNFDSYI
jgi:hypothetical protein